MKKKDISCLVLGIGNILWADEGFGVRAADEFNSRYALEDPAAQIIDGGTLGMYLFDRICRTERLLVIDCCDFKEEKGTMKVLRNDDIKLWASTKISPHQAGMNDLLCSAALQDALPSKITVIGVQPAELDDFGGSISELLKPKLSEAAELAAEELNLWGVPFRKRREDEKVLPLREADALNLGRYEEERPLYDKDGNYKGNGIRTRLREDEC